MQRYIDDHEDPDDYDDVPEFPPGVGQAQLNRPRQNPDDRVIMNNNNGQYNLNFIDWENEWENAYEAMEGDPDEEFIQGIRNGDIE